MTTSTKSGPASAGRCKAARVFSALLALSAALVAPISAQAASSTDDAQKLLRLDMMLMVTGLRCRGTSDNFLADFDRFSAKHMGTLNQAVADLRSNFAQRFGKDAAQGVVDRLAVSMANQYGAGHPWLDCGQLKMVTSNLAQVDGRETLVEAADQLLSQRPVEHFALAGH